MFGGRKLGKAAREDESAFDIMSKDYKNLKRELEDSS